MDDDPILFLLFAAFMVVAVLALHDIANAPVSNVPCAIGWEFTPDGCVPPAR